MSKVLWIKITTSMFDDEKIDFIESLPEADAILIIWIKLLTLAGKSNTQGLILLSDTIPYTEDMLAHKFRRPLNTIKLALSTFHRLNMIHYEDQAIKISNWEKHQNVEGLDKIREQNRLRAAKYRERQKLEEVGHVTPNVTSHVTSQSNHALDIEIEKELELDLELEKDIVAYLNSQANKNYREDTKETQRLIRARLKEGYKLEDFKKVIDKKTRDWLRDQKMNPYLRPSTLFGSKFESYLNEVDSKPSNDYGW